MRLKQKMSLLLASVMAVGSVGMINPVEARAEETRSSFTLTVPADTSLTKTGWNDIGSVGVSDASFTATKEVRVAIIGGATGRKLVNTENSSEKIKYDIKKGTSEASDEYGDQLVFTTNGTQPIGAEVSDFSKAINGTYEDTVIFSAALTGVKNQVAQGTKAEDLQYTLTEENAPDRTILKVSDLLKSETGTFKYNGKTYTAYNGL